MKDYNDMAMASDTEMASMNGEYDSERAEESVRRFARFLRIPLEERSADNPDICTRNIECIGKILAIENAMQNALEVLYKNSRLASTKEVLATIRDIKGGIVDSLSKDESTAPIAEMPPLVGRSWRDLLAKIIFAEYRLLALLDSSRELTHILLREQTVAVLLLMLDR